MCEDAPQKNEIHCPVVGYLIDEATSEHSATVQTFLVLLSCSVRGVCVHGQQKTSEEKF